MTAPRIVGDLRRAGGYLVEGAQLVRRHPSLLLLPLAVAVFNLGEGYAGSQAMLRYTALGRWVTQQREQRAPLPTAPVQARVLKMEMGGAPDAVGVHLTGTSALLLGALAIGDGEPYSQWPSNALVIFLSAVVTVVLIAPVNALVAGGYYATLAGTVRRGGIRWNQFGTLARRFAGRLWVLYLIFSGLLGAMFYLLPAIQNNTALARVPFSLLVWCVQIAAFFLVLIPFALIWDDCSVVAAIRRGVRAVTGDIAVAIGLVASGVLVGRILVWVYAAVPPVGGYRTLSAAGLHLWTALGVRLIYDCASAAVGALFAAAYFFWYRDASARLVPAVETVPAAEEQVSMEES